MKRSDTLPADGAVIRQLREAKYGPRKSITGISIPTLRNAEAGKNILIRHLERIAAALGTTLDIVVKRAPARVEQIQNTQLASVPDGDHYSDLLFREKYATEESDINERDGASSEDQAFVATCGSTFYQWNSIRAQAVRLVGAQEENFPPERITVSFEQEPYLVPKELQLDRAEIIETAETRAKALDYALFNGACVRLAKYRASPRDPSEEKHLELTLGKTTWYDFIVANQRFNDPGTMQPLRPDLRITDFIDFETLSRERTVGSSQLTNILTVYVTATTSDGFLVYSKRTGRVASHQHQLMCAVSENIHPTKDAVMNSLAPESFFLTAARGISEELSPKLVPVEPSKEMYLLGLDFHLHGYHPGLLFYLPLAATREEVLKAYCESLGKDFHESILLFASLRDSSQLNTVLSEPSWFSAGKACIIRTFEFMSSDEVACGQSLAQVASRLGSMRK